MFLWKELGLEFIKATLTLVTLGGIWLQIQAAHRRRQCQLGEPADDESLKSCLGCHHLSRCRRKTE